MASCRSLTVGLSVLVLSLTPIVERSWHVYAVEEPKGRFLGLQEAIELALEQHPLVKSGEANTKAAEARTEQTRSLYYPQVFANVDLLAGAGGVNPRFVAPAGSLLRPNLSQYAGGVIASQRVYDFGQRRDLLISSQLLAAAEGYDLTARRALVALQVQQAYLTSLKRRRLVQIAEDTVRERGVIRSQVETLYRQQLKSKLDLDLVQVELTNAESMLVKARNDLRASFADLNRAMGLSPEAGTDYVLEELAIEPRPLGSLEALLAESLSHPEVKRARELGRAAEARVRAAKKQYLPTVSAIASAGSYDTFANRPEVSTGGWWSAAGLISMPLFTGFLIENQVREASAQQQAAEATTLDVEQALTQQVTNAYLAVATLAQQIKLAEEQIRTAQEALSLARQRYKLGLGSVVEVTQSEVAVTGAQTHLAEAQYDYKIAEAMLAYAAARHEAIFTPRPPSSGRPDSPDLGTLAREAY